MARWLFILVPVAFGGVAFHVMQPKHWDDIQQGLLFALSLLGAAVLVRLARGMPVSNVEFFEVEEIRRLTKAVTGVYRALIFLLSAIVMSIVGLVFIGVWIKAIGGLSELDPGTTTNLQQVATAVLVFFITYALSRTISLVLGDYDLVKLQGKLMERVVERRHAERRAQALEEAAEARPFEPREGYGKLRQ